MTCPARSCCPGPGGGSEAVIFEIDWASLPSQTINADGPVAIDGTNWEMDNVAAAAGGEVNIVNGIGLVFGAAAGVSRSWGGATMTAPALHVELSALFADVLRYDRPMSIWSYFSAHSFPESSNVIAAGVWTPTTDGSCAIFHRFGAAPGPTIQGGTGFEIPTITVAQAVGANVLVWRRPTASLAEVYSGVWSGAWPAFDGSLVQVGHDNSGFGDTLSPNDFVCRSGARLIYSAMTRNVIGAPGFTLARTRIVVGYT